MASNEYPKRHEAGYHNGNHVEHIENVNRRAPHAEHGVLVDHIVDGPTPIPAHPELRWARIRRHLRESFSEFLGTFILVLFGDGAIAQTVLSNKANGSWLTICWGYGVGLMIGIYTAGISGAHINPAVTLTNCVFRNFSWRKFPIYVLAQTLGAMCAAAVIYGNYKSAINAFEGYNIRTVPGGTHNTSTAGIFATYPTPFMTRGGQFFDEFIGTALLMFSIYALKDDENVGAGNLTPLALFFVLSGIAVSFGWETGFALNTARDFGPRLVTYMLGYGHEVWSAGGYYFWIPMVAPCLGALFGGLLYDTLLFTGQSPINAPGLGFQKYYKHENPVTPPASGGRPRVYRSYTGESRQRARAADSIV